MLTAMTLLLAHPVVARQHAGVATAPVDVSADNVAFVGAHWTEVDALMDDLARAVGEQSRR